MLIEKSVVWPIVFAFFHPELRKSERGEYQSPFEGLLSGSIGIAQSSPHGEMGAFSEIEPRYEGIPASLVFESYDPPTRNQYWRAQLDLVTGVSVGANVVVSVTNADGEAIKDGTLILLGSTLRVTNGLAIYSLAQFQQTLDNTEVSLTLTPGGRPVVGTLKFGEEMLL